MARRAGLTFSASVGSYDFIEVVGARVEWGVGD